MTKYDDALRAFAKSIARNVEAEARAAGMPASLDQARYELTIVRQGHVDPKMLADAKFMATVMPAVNRVLEDVDTHDCLACGSDLKSEREISIVVVAYPISGADLMPVVTWAVCLACGDGSDDSIMDSVMRDMAQMTGVVSVGETANPDHA